MKTLLPALAALCIFSLPVLAAPVITFEEQAVVAQVTPGATTAWFSVVHQWQSYRLKIFDRAQLLVDEDGDGIVRMELSGPSKRNSVWMVTDLDSGEYAFAVPEGCTLRREPLPPDAVHFASHWVSSSLTVADDSVIVWLIRPGTGAWIVPVDDGSSSDLDSLTDGTVTASSAQLQPVGDTLTTNLNFIDGDIVVAIDPKTLKVLDLRVTQ